MCRCGARRWLLTSVALVAGCTTVSRDDPPCYEGWIGGTSTVVSLEPGVESELVEFLGEDRELMCVHSLADGSLYAVVYERGSWFGSLGRFGRKFWISDGVITIDDQEQLIVTAT